MGPPSIQYSIEFNRGTVTTASSGRAIPASTDAFTRCAPPQRIRMRIQGTRYLRPARGPTPAHIQRGARITLTRGSTSTHPHRTGPTRRRRYRSMAAGEGRRVSAGGCHHVARVGGSGIGRGWDLGGGGGYARPAPRASW